MRQPHCIASSTIPLKGCAPFASLPPPTASASVIVKRSRATCCPILRLTMDTTLSYPCILSMGGSIISLAVLVLCPLTMPVATFKTARLLAGCPAHSSQRQHYCPLRPRISIIPVLLKRHHRALVTQHPKRVCRGRTHHRIRVVEQLQERLK